MVKILFFNIPAHGHTNPTLPIVSELIERGVSVIYYSFSSLQSKIEQTGATYRTYPINEHSYDESTLKDFPILFRVFLEATEKLLPFVLNEINEEKPDCIIHDSLCVWGKLAAEITATPAICSNSTFAFDESFIDVKSEIIRSIPAFIKGDAYHLLKGLFIQQRLYRKYNVKKPPLLDFLKNKENLNLVYTSPMFQPNSANMDSSYRFVGPSLPIVIKDKWTIKKKPFIYISLGTIFGNNKEFYESCFKAFQHVDADFVVSLGNAMSKTEFTNIPKNFVVEDFVQQLDILQQTDLFISHGGMNSVQEALYFNVPLICIPQQQEQEMVAKQVEDLGCGIRLKHMSISRLFHAYEQIIHDYHYYKSNSVLIGDTLENAGGYMKAVDEILNYI